MLALATLGACAAARPGGELAVSLLPDNVDGDGLWIVGTAWPLAAQTTAEAIQNILAMLLTSYVSQDERSSTKPPFTKNKSDMSVTLETHHVPMGQPYVWMTSQAFSPLIQEKPPAV